MTEYYAAGDALTEVHRDVELGSTLMAVATNELMAMMIRKALEHYEAATSEYARGMDDPGLSGLMALNRGLAEQRDALHRLVGEVRDELMKLATEMRGARTEGEVVRLLNDWTPKLSSLVAALAPAPGSDARDAREGVPTAMVNGLTIEAPTIEAAMWAGTFLAAHVAPPKPEPFQIQRWYRETGIRAAIPCRHPVGAIAHTARPNRTWCERCGWDTAAVPDTTLA